MTGEENIGRAFLIYSGRRLSNEYFPRIEQCLMQLSEEDVWWRPNEESNSIGNLMLHLCGNVRQWLVHGIGGAPDKRNRESEFSAHGSYSKIELIALMKRTLQEADVALREFPCEKLLEVRHIQLFDITCLDAISHVVEHFAQHTAQIVYITKLRKGGVVDFFATYFPSPVSPLTP